ncbi:MAG: hypothetical protein ILP24_07775 [Paludibacteraceae bacterium]|nr:hypothetical protein [Paludibacteraceae bacterium]
MKKLLLLFVLFYASLMTMAQDVIVKKDGSTIQSKVLEINGTEIKYKKWSNLEGPLYNINKNEIYSINYQNGEVELITIETNPQSSYSNNERMERKGMDLALNGRKLYGEEIRFLVGDQNYQTYLSARKQIGTGNIFAIIFGASLGTTIVLVLFKEWDAAIISGVIADVSLPLLCVLKGVGKGRINWVADEYNINRRASACFYQISPSIMKCNSMMSQNNLGLGLTFSVNF